MVSGSLCSTSFIKVESNVSLVVPLGADKTHDASDGIFTHLSNDAYTMNIALLEAPSNLLLIGSNHALFI